MFRTVNFKAGLVVCLILFSFNYWYITKWKANQESHTEHLKELISNMERLLNSRNQTENKITKQGSDFEKPTKWVSVKLKKILSERLSFNSYGVKC